MRIHLYNAIWEYNYSEKSNKYNFNDSFLIIQYE